MIDLILPAQTIGDIELVIFDRDGTLIDLYHYWSQMLYLRAEQIIEVLKIDKTHISGLVSAMGVDEAKHCIKPEGPVGLKKREIVMQSAINYLDSQGFHSTYDICFDVFKKVDLVTENKLDQLIKPIDGMYKLLNSLKANGCLIALATTDRTARAELSLKYLGINDDFVAVIGADSVSESKPASDMIDLILSKTGTARSKTVMVGDALTDIQMGLNARVKASIGVCTGLTTGDDLLKLTPYVINDISEIGVE